MAQRAAECNIARPAEGSETGVEKSQLGARVSETGLRAPAGLATLDANTLLVIFGFLDELPLVRLSSVCWALHSPSRQHALWEPLLTSFFDGELPPALCGTDDALSVLRQQVEFAQHMIAAEREQRRFPLPLVGSLSEWSRGEVRFFGQFIRWTAREDGPSSWIRLDTVPSASTVCAFADVDFGPLAEWKDSKLATMAVMGDRRLAERLASRHATAQQERGPGAMYHSPWPGDTHATPARNPAQLATQRLSVPKLQAELYGGLFALRRITSAEGAWYSLSCVDGSYIEDFSGV